MAPTIVPLVFKLKIKSRRSADCGNLEFITRRLKVNGVEQLLLQIRLQFRVISNGEQIVGKPVPSGSIAIRRTHSSLSFGFSMGMHPLNRRMPSGEIHCLFRIQPLLAEEVQCMVMDG